MIFDLSTSFEIYNAVKQGDALACLLFNIAIEKVIRDVGTVFNKSAHILAHADVVDIMARSRSA